MRPSHAAAAAVFLLFGAGLPLGAQAQNPSAESIIQSLKPTGGTTTRGIHPVGPSAGGEAAPAAGGGMAPMHQRRHGGGAMPAAITETGGAPSVNLTVQFRTGSAELTGPARHTLDELGRALSSPKLAGYHFRIEGHTDTVGSAALNKELSQKRADSVVSYLENKFGVASDRLQPVGMGEEGLLVPTPPNTAEPRNRRVTVVNTGA